MPKVYLTEAAKNAAHAADGDEALRVSVATRMMRSGLKQGEIAKRIGMTPSTFSRRLQKPDTLTIGELRRLAAVLGMTEAETARCV